MEIITRCHACARTFEIIVADGIDIDDQYYEIPPGQYASCPHCPKNHTAGHVMKILN